MEIGLLAVLFIGFLLGIKHAIEPDHIVAVSTIASQSKSLWRSTLAGIYWGIGHTLTLFIFGVAVILMKRQIPEVVALSFEFLVGVMLIYLGIHSIRALKKAKLHSHVHAHSGGNVHNHIHSHQKLTNHDHTHHHTSNSKSLVIGFIHGLAGSAAMVVLTMETVANIGQAIAYILIFGAGTIVGMLFFTTIFGIPFILSAKRININDALIKVTGGISVIFGLYYMYSIGVTEGLFRLWIS